MLSLAFLRCTGAPSAPPGVLGGAAKLQHSSHVAFATLLRREPLTEPGGKLRVRLAFRLWFAGGSRESVPGLQRLIASQLMPLLRQTLTRHCLPKALAGRASPSLIRAGAGPWLFALRPTNSASVSWRR